ncbi:uncharacterized protein BO66DRAFT_438633 [Aspergillus aculeatinus CBS 121060]|uniref:Uncharacterized protein n=1 Tax=Aspergillus aculeatinus CBS 121060 TaxID=1448322 RepID=A0ACD1H8W8_9EURO|nr:hypothetical protein BO66DRAFT_438633 [Aspergillus aculeatinus CBS 121060]RAH69929.1 hypothetical protein BO66DRAFT_438633 [Aspergillus aculeatinus CBS 121060]
MDSICEVQQLGKYVPDSSDTFYIRHAVEHPVTAWLNLWDERFCEDVGDFNGAQEAQARLYFQREAGQLGHVEALVRNDVDLNFAIQREAALQSELKTLSVWLVISGAADVTTAEEIYSRIQTVETQLSALEETIWHLERRTHVVLSRFPEGPLALAHGPATQGGLHRPRLVLRVPVRMLHQAEKHGPCEAGSLYVRLRML